MPQSGRERIAGSILFAVACIWSVGVWLTIPGAAEAGRIGPRGFPLAMGFALAGLSALLVIRSFGIGGAADPEPEAGGTTNDRSEWFGVLATFGFLVGYVLLLPWIGFVMATVACCALFLVYVLGKRSPALVAGMSLGLGFGIWLILGKAMGVYLPRGVFFDWF